MNRCCEYTSSDCLGVTTHRCRRRLSARCRYHWAKIGFFRFRLRQIRLACCDLIHLRHWDESGIYPFNFTRPNCSFEVGDVFAFGFLRGNSKFLCWCNRGNMRDGLQNRWFGFCDHRVIGDLFLWRFLRNLGRGLRFSYFLLFFIAESPFFSFPGSLFVFSGLCFTLLFF